jgi:transglutaminase-like putative cysteine protease
MAARELPVSVALAALSATVALAFGAAFASDAYVAPLVGAALLPHAIGWITRRWTRSGTRGAGIAALGLVVYTAGLLGAPGPATISRLTDRVQAGWTLVQHSTVPIRATDGTVLLAVFAMWLVASLADTLAFRHRMSVGALAPGMMTVICVRAFSTHGWVPSTVGFGVAAVAFLALQHQVLLGQSRTPVGRSAGGYVPRLLATAFLAGVAAVVIGAAVAPALPGGDHPIIPDIGSSGGGSYQTKVPPDVNVGDQLVRGARQEVFTVQASQPAYWRQTALDTYSEVGGGSWTLNAQGNGAVGSGLSGPLPSGALHQTFRIGSLGERWMPAAFEPVAVNRSGTLVVQSSATLVTSQSTVNGLTYTVDSRLPSLSPTAAERAATAAPVPSSLHRYLAVPASVTANVRATEQQVVRGLTTPYDQAAALRDFFRNGSFTYDATVKLGDDASAMSTFLQQRSGFCVQFASTYAVMARLAGIPSRLAVGYAQGTPDAKGVYHVTTDDAHAWPEVWLAGIGWTNQFEPTPAGPLPGESHLPGEPPTVGTPTPRQTPVPATTPVTTPAAPGSPNGSGTGSPPAAAGRGATVTRTATGGSGSAVGGVLLIAAVLLIGVALTAAFVAARKRRRRSRRRAGSDPATLIGGAWAEVLDELREAGVGWPVSLTPLELASGLRGRVDPGIPPPLTSLAHRYTAARYGDAPPESGSGDAAWRDAEAVLRALESSLDLRTRLRAQFATRPRGQPDPAGWSLPRSRSTKV